MNKEGLIKAIADRTELSRTACSDVLDAALNVIEDTLAVGDKVKIVGFGTFTPKSRPAREARNPRNGDVINVPPSVAIHYKPSKVFLNNVNDKPSS